MTLPFTLRKKNVVLSHVLLFNTAKRHTLQDKLLLNRRIRLLSFIEKQQSSLSLQSFDVVFVSNYLKIGFEPFFLHIYRYPFLFFFFFELRVRDSNFFHVKSFVELPLGYTYNHTFLSFSFLFPFLFLFILCLSVIWLVFISNKIIIYRTWFRSGYHAHICCPILIVYILTLA